MKMAFEKYLQAKKLRSYLWAAEEQANVLMKGLLRRGKDECELGNIFNEW